MSAPDPSTGRHHRHHRLQVLDRFNEGSREFVIVQFLPLFFIDWNEGLAAQGTYIFQYRTEQTRGTYSLVVLAPPLFFFSSHDIRQPPAKSSTRGKT